MIIEGELTPAPTKALTMNIFDALRKVQQGEKIARIAWDNKDYCLMRDGWLTIYTKGDFHTWSVNDGDMEGNEWVLVKETND